MRRAHPRDIAQAHCERNRDTGTLIVWHGERATFLACSIRAPQELWHALSDAIRLDALDYSPDAQDPGGDEREAVASF